MGMVQFLGRFFNPPTVHRSGEKVSVIAFDNMTMCFLSTPRKIADNPVEYRGFGKIV
jgi:hypothetical protein